MPLSDEQGKVILAGHAAGRSQRSIARELGVSHVTVKNWGHEQDPPLTWDRSQTATATLAASRSNATRRADLCTRALVEAEALLDKLHQPCIVYSFGGKENDYNQKVLEEPPAKDVRDYMSAFGVLIQKSAELSRLDDSTSSNVRSMLTALGESLGLAPEVVAETPAPAAE